MFKRNGSPGIMKRAGRLSVGYKISIGITIVIIFLMLIVGINSYLSNRSMMLEEAKFRGWMTARTTGAFAADYLRSNNKELLGNIIDHLERDPFVKKVVILDLNGNVFMSSNSDIIGKKFENPNMGEVLNKKTDVLKYESDVKGQPLSMQFFSPITPRTTGPVGYFWMETDLSYISDHLLATAYNQLYTSLLAILAGLIISRLIVLRAIRRPVKELMQATDRVSTGDFSGQVQIFYEDDLGRLASAFNTMTGHLGVLFQSIRSSVNDINHTAQAIINRSEQSDIAVRKLMDTLERLQQSASQLPEIAEVHGHPLLASGELDQTAETTRNQQENLKEIRNSSKRLVRYIDRLNSISLQFKFNEK